MVEEGGAAASARESKLVAAKSTAWISSLSQAKAPFPLLEMLEVAICCGGVV